MMFKRQGSLSRIGGVIQAFERFIRKLQTDVEHTRVTNAMPVNELEVGHVLAILEGGGVKNVELAVAFDGNPQWAGIACEPVAIGGKGVMQTNGRASVLFTLLPAINTLAYVSLTAGYATDVAPALQDEWVVPIGRIVDVSGWAATGRCDVILGQCCLAESN